MNEFHRQLVTSSSVAQEIRPNRRVYAITQTGKMAPHLKTEALLWEATRRVGALTEEAVLRWFDEIIAMIEKGCTA